MTRNRWMIYGLLILFGLSLFVFLDLKNTTVPYDEAYSISMIKLSYGDIVSVTANDVHPPLYYWTLKLYSQTVGSSMFSLRLFSTLGVLATILLGCFPVRKLFGDKVSFLFILLLIITPVTQYIATDIRMYSWTMFFVLACALYGYKVYKSGNIKSWILFFFTGLGAAYMHNYGLLAVFGIYLALLVSIAVNDKKKVRYLLLCATLFFLAYLPWLIHLVGQVQNITEDYWIKPLTLNDLFLHIYYFYSPKEIWLPFTDFTKNQMIVWLVLILSTQFVLSLRVVIDGYRDKNIYVVGAIMAFIIFLFPILVGTLASLLFVPVLVTRYMTCSFALFILSLAFILAKASEYTFYKKLTYIFLLLLLIDGGMRLHSNVGYYHQTEKAYNEIRHFTGQDRQTFLVNDFSYHVMPRLQLIVPENDYYILAGDKRTNFAPFLFNEKGIVDFDHFILVHQKREAVQPDFLNYWSVAGKEFAVTDSLHASDIYLYKVRRK